MSSLAENPPTAASASEASEASDDQNVPNDHKENYDNESSNEENENCPSLEQRFAAMESKLKIVDNAFNLDQATEQFIKQDSLQIPLEMMSWVDAKRYHNANLEFYWDTISFMSKIRTTYQRIQDLEKVIKAHQELKVQVEVDIMKEDVSEAAKSLSIEAFSKGVRATIVEVDWKYFTDEKWDLDESILTPIEVVSSEPEPGVIFRLNPIRTGEATVSELLARRPTERTVWDKDLNSHGEKPLPERIKIHSSPLVAILRRFIGRNNFELAKDKSMVFLRPYKELFYREDSLREQLSKLETQFEGFDSTQLTSTPLSTQDLKMEEFENHDESGSAKDVVNTEADILEMLSDDGSQEDTSEAQLEELQNEEIGENDQDEHNPGSITGLLHMRCLMEFFDNGIKAKAQYVDSPDCTSVSFHDLWYLFKPGDRVIDQRQKQAYVVVHIKTPLHKVEDLWLRWKYKQSDEEENFDKYDQDDRVSMHIHCVYIDFDGKQLGPVPKKFRIPQYGGLKDIISLPVYPLRYTNNSDLQDTLRERGEMLLDISRFKPMYYMGYTLDTRDEIDSQVVVDFNEALSDETRREAWEPTITPLNTNFPDIWEDDICYAPCCNEQAVHDDNYVDSTLTEEFVRRLVPTTSLGAPSLLLSPRPLEDVLRDGEGLSDDELIVMTYRVFGFVLRSRKWAQLDLTFLRYEDADGRGVSVNAFNRLELPEGHREMVKSLVIQHFRSKQTSFTKDEQTDLIKGKGKGLIMLLHGAPGVGKTTTAEGIAEVFKKPLFQITCGDLGTTAREVEEALERNFALASRWGCILLLDEADVFLAARDRLDFVRNGLVSVFLRVLEYYTGILFLTTNRIGDFDEAFASRIHMSLFYPALDEQKTIRVFQLNLNLIRDRFKEQGREIIYDASSVEDFARQHFLKHEYGRWNGRQIRNLCQTALALAEFDAQGEELDAKIDKSIPVSLQLKYFKTVQEAYLSYGKYLGDIRGTKGDRRAIDYGLRARQDTPYQARPSRFAQKADEMASQNWQGNPPTLSPSNSSHYHVASQGDPFQPINQGQIFAGQGMNMPSQQYQPYPQPQQQQQQQYYQQQPMTTMDNMGYNVPSGSGFVGQVHSEPRAMQSQQSNTQYMQYQQGSQGAPRNMNVNLQGSPVHQNSFQGQPQEQRFSNGPQGQGLTSHVQVSSISMAESSSSYN